MGNQIVSVIGEVDGEGNSHGDVEGGTSGQSIFFLCDREDAYNSDVDGEVDNSVDVDGEDNNNKDVNVEVTMNVVMSAS